MSHKFIRLCLVYSLAGTWKDDFPSLEEIRSSTGEDVLRQSF